MSVQTITQARHAYQVFVRLSKNAHISRKEADALVEACLLDLHDSKNGTIEDLEAIARDTKNYIKAARGFIGGNEAAEARAILNTFRRLQKAAMEELNEYMMYESMVEMPEYVNGSIG